MKSTMRRKADPVAAGRGSQGRPKNMVFAVIEVEMMDILWSERQELSILLKKRGEGKSFLFLTFICSTTIFARGSRKGA